MPRTRGAKIMAGILLGYFFLLFWMACRKFNACTGDTNDISQLDCAYYMTFHGKFLWVFSMNTSVFEAHAEPLMLMVLPFYYFVPSPKTLLFLQTLCITVAAIPIYLIGRKLLEHEAAGILMALAFLLNPSLIGQNINQAQTAVFPLPFLLFAFYFFQEKRLLPFCICLGIASLGKENIPLTALMFVPYALWKRRPWVWTVAAGLIPVSALALSLEVIRPQFSQGRSYIALSYYPGFGNSLGDFVKTILTQPDKVAAALFTSANGPYVALMLMAVGVFLPFLAAEIIFVVPEAVLNLLSSNTGMKVPVWLYNIYLGTFLIIASMYAIAKLSRYLGPRLGPAKYGPVMAGCLVALSLSNWWQWFHPQEYEYLPQHEAQQKAFAIIPRDDSLLVGPGPLVGHVDQRKILITAHMHELERAKGRNERFYRANWVLFDMNYRIPQPGWYVPKDLFMDYATNSNYEVVFNQDNVFVFHRRVSLDPNTMPDVRWAEVAQ
jgi:uncharacterized membrane protein